MGWEHRYCGTIFDSKLPPTECDFCRTLLVKVTKDRDKGWRRIGPDVAEPPSPGAGVGDQGAKTKRPYSRAQKRALAKAEGKKRGRRGKISKAKRERIYKRDGYECVRCGENDKRELTLDHIIPVSRGGSSKDDNLQTMCKRCNVLKGSKTASNGMRWPPAREMRRRGL
jgi:hypothetical protein